MIFKKRQNYIIYIFLVSFLTHFTGVSRGWGLCKTIVRQFMGERKKMAKYPTKTYRLSKEVSNKLDNLRVREDLIWDKLFKKLIEFYEQHKE